MRMGEERRLERRRRGYKGRGILLVNLLLRIAFMWHEAARPLAAGTCPGYRAPTSLVRLLLKIRTKIQSESIPGPVTAPPIIHTIEPGTWALGTSLPRRHNLCICSTSSSCDTILHSVLLYMLLTAQRRVGARMLYRHLSIAAAAGLPGGFTAWMWKEGVWALPRGCFALQHWTSNIHQREPDIKLPRDPPHIDSGALNVQVTWRSRQ